MLLSTLKVLHINDTNKIEFQQKVQVYNISDIKFLITLPTVKGSFYPYCTKGPTNSR